MPRHLLILTLGFSILISAPLSYTAVINEKFLDQCMEQHWNCTHKLPEDYTSDGLIADNLSHAPLAQCTSTFHKCVEASYESSGKSRECYLAESGWENFEISVWASAFFVVFNNIIFPITIRTLLLGLNSLYRLSLPIDQRPPDYAPAACWGRHACLLRIATSIGTGFGRLYDDDKNKEVTHNEFLSPTAFITIASLASPFAFLYIANDRQAECDYTKDQELPNGNGTNFETPNDPDSPPFIPLPTDDRRNLRQSRRSKDLMKISDEDKSHSYWQRLRQFLPF